MTSTYDPNLTGDVRMRCSGGESVLLDFGGFTVLSAPGSVAALPERIDVVVLCRSQPLTALPQLCGRTDVIVVPKALGIAVRAVVEHLGFPEVVELSSGQAVEFGPARITLPSAGGEPVVPLVRLGGHDFAFGADAARLPPDVLDDVVIVAELAGTTAERLWPVRDKDL